MLYLYHPFFICSLFFIVINHKMSLKQTHLFFVHFLEYFRMINCSKKANNFQITKVQLQHVAQILVNFLPNYKSVAYKLKTCILKTDYTANISCQCYVNFQNCCESCRTIFKPGGHQHHFPRACNAICCMASATKVTQLVPCGFSKIFASCNMKNCYCNTATKSNRFDFAAVPQQQMCFLNTSQHDFIVVHGLQHKFCKKTEYDDNYITFFVITFKEIVCNV